MSEVSELSDVSEEANMFVCHSLCFSPATALSSYWMKVTQIGQS